MPPDSGAQQHERCKFAIESLQFANQISGNDSRGISVGTGGGGNYLKYHKKRNSMKKSRRSNKRKQSRKRKIIRI